MTAILEIRQRKMSDSSHEATIRVGPAAKTGDHDMAWGAVYRTGWADANFKVGLTGLQRALVEQRVGKLQDNLVFEILMDEADALADEFMRTNRIHECVWIDSTRFETLLSSKSEGTVPPDVS